MAHKKGGPSSRLLTEVELELMTIIWRLGEVAVKDVVDALPEGTASSASAGASRKTRSESRRVRTSCPAR